MDRQSDSSLTPIQNEVLYSEKLKNKDDNIHNTEALKSDISIFAECQNLLDE